MYAHNIHGEIPNRLRLVDSVQLDTILPFLRGIPSQAFLNVWLDESGDDIMIPQQHCPSHDSQRSIQLHLTKLASRTFSNMVLHKRRPDLYSDAIRIIHEVDFPLKAGTVLEALSSLGTTIARSITVGEFYAPAEVPPRTPTECLVVLLDIMDSAGSSLIEHQREALKHCIKDAESYRLRSRITIEDISHLLQNTAKRLETTCLFQLAASTKALHQELKSHGPAGPHLTRLHDNVYGRVWETLLNTRLAEEAPPRLMEATQKMRQAFLGMMRQVPEHLGYTVRKNFMDRLGKESPRPWPADDKRLTQLSHDDCTDAAHFEEFLKLPTTSGSEAMGDYLVGKLLLHAFKEVTPDLFPWRDQAGARYSNDIIPRKGKLKFAHMSTEDKFGSGITLAHHASASDGCRAMRVVLHMTWDLDISVTGGSTCDSSNAVAMKHGVPVCTSISGYTHLFASFFVEIQDTMELDLAHAVLGLLIYLVVEGGHTWNECLLTLNYLENKLSIGLLPASYDMATFVADYSSFISIFNGCETEEYITRAVAYANKGTILYRRRMVGRPLWQEHS